MGKTTACRIEAALAVGTEVACGPARVESYVARPRGRGFHWHGSTLAMPIRCPFRRSLTPGASRERIRRRPHGIARSNIPQQAPRSHHRPRTKQQNKQHTTENLHLPTRNSDDMAMAWPVAVRSQETRSAEGGMRRRGPCDGAGTSRFLLPLEYEFAQMVTTFALLF